MLRTLALSLPLAVIVGLTLSSPEARAGATIVVNSFEDEDVADDYCTLREAITAANNNSDYHGCVAGGYGDDVIVFNGVREGTVIRLKDKLFILDAGSAGTLTITGPDKPRLTISGDSDGDGIPDVSIFWAIGQGEATFNNLDIESGGDSDGGLHVSTFRTVTVNNCTFTRNKAHEGAAIKNRGTLTVNDSTFSENVSLINGGAISNWGGTVVINGSSFNGNAAPFGGAIASGHGSVMISQSTFVSNDASVEGGAVTAGGELTVEKSTFAANQAMGDGGGVLATGYVTITASTFVGNGAARNGGGLSVIDPSSGDPYPDAYAHIATSLFSMNSAQRDGGGIGNTSNGIFHVSNSTVYGNNAGHGGGIYNGPPNPNNGMKLFNVTISDNAAFLAGGGIFSTITRPIYNTIVANSLSGGDCAGASLSGHHNIVEDGSCGFSAGGDPDLAPLGDYGGPTETMALHAGSPAIDAGDDGICADPPVSGEDQRGVSRLYGKACDIGAFEFTGNEAGGEKK
jgi:CSLREA domain-containing protein